jgi:hypothetical protein
MALRPELSLAISALRRHAASIRNRAAATWPQKTGQMAARIGVTEPDPVLCPTRDKIADALDRLASRLEAEPRP